MPPSDLTSPNQLQPTRSQSSDNNKGSLARAAIARDIEQRSKDVLDDTMDSDVQTDDNSDSDLEALQHVTSNSQVSMVGSYRRPSLAGAGSRAAMGAGFQVSRPQPSKRERREAREQERSLLKDNHIIPPKHPRQSNSDRSLSRRLSRPFLGKRVPDASSSDNVRHVGPTSENAPLLGDPSLPYGGQDTQTNLDQKWEEAVLEGKIKTTWRREAKVLARYSGPLILTFILQYSLTVASIFTVGHLGKVELGAVSLASVTANITGYAIYQGLATSLDTLCPQAYGSGRKKLVGLQTQRMVYFLWCITVPIGIVWLCADFILIKIVPEDDVAILAGRYLKIILIGAPGYACFESMKRFLQAQGLFSASLYVLLFFAPLNAFMNWFFVWQLKFGFVGAPIAVAVTDNLLPIGLLIYIRFVAGRGCWPGFTMQAFTNWGPMIRLAIPGLLMVEAEYAAFEILTLAASYFGTAPLAAQSVLSTLAALAFQIPFPISIATSTRIANLIGATLADVAKVSAKVAALVSIVVGLVNMVLLSSLRHLLPRLFTSDPDVSTLVADTLPLCAAFQLFDALTCYCNGALRGLGKQKIGGYVQPIAYYLVAMPISIGTAFGLGWELKGLWAGVAVGLGAIAFVEGIFLIRTDWEKSVLDAKSRNQGD